MPVLEQLYETTPPVFNCYSRFDFLIRHRFQTLCIVVFIYSILAQCIEVGLISQ